MAGPTVAAVVVTHNRRELLRGSLGAILGQTRAVDRLLVVDNASTDGTKEMLGDEFPEARVVALASNQGGAGGFHEGIKEALREGTDWLWLMDDDCFPEPTALAELLAALERLDAGSPALLASRVEWQDGEPHGTNMPQVARRDAHALVDAVDKGLLPLRATTFVSLLLAREAVEREGLPPRHFFYQGDDIEYTARILRRARGYFVPESVVEHRTASQPTPVPNDHRFHHHIRNSVYMLRGDAWTRQEKLGLAWAVAGSAIDYLRLTPSRLAGVRTVAGAVREGLRSPIA